MESPLKNSRDYFLHVIEIGEENDAVMSNMESIRRDGQVGVHLEAINTRILFQTGEQMSISIQFGEAEEENY